MLLSALKIAFTRVLGIRLDDIAAVVGRGLVEAIQLEVLVGLGHDPVEPPRQVPCVM